MTRLLVSVRDAQEALFALDGGADIVDVKEPNRGSLGAADRETLLRIAAAIGSQVPLSLALGELCDFVQLPFDDVLRSYGFAKLGLANCAGNTNWQQNWQEVYAALPEWMTRVAVVYADYQRAKTPAPSTIVQAAHALGCGVLLIDTHCKSHGDLFDVCETELLRKTITQARRFGMKIALAGSLSIPKFGRAIDLGADILAVRGAVCRGTRAESLDPELVVEVREQLRVSLFAAKSSQGPLT